MQFKKIQAIIAPLVYLIKVKTKVWKVSSLIVVAFCRSASSKECDCTEISDSMLELQ